MGVGYSTNVGLAFSVPASGWIRGSEVWGDAIMKASYAALEAGLEPEARIRFATASPDGVYADPCRHVRSDPIGRSTETDATEDRRQHSADLADALAAIPGMDVTGPSDVTVGGLPAKHVILTVPQDLECYPLQFYLWYDWDAGTRSAGQGDTIRIWIVDYQRFGLRYWIEAETPSDASPELEHEIQQIIDSITFAG